MAVVNKWSTCDLPSKPDADVFPTDSMYSFQAIRPATGTEIPELNLPAGDYAVIRYVFIPFKGNETSADFSGIIFRSDSPNTTTPGGVAASINGKDYYLFTGEYGKKASQKNIESQVIKKGPNGPFFNISATACP